ncbi:hypothetical protein LCGC14_0371190 [marine sediment metagenome]|uniref:Uncharacterized protein n=1 Tax=marine sediment metagenome TaxID=412755 RepID=A0A0F9WDX3_9ZZZZ|nr:hypothetical protein [Maribacter sp.]HDZ04875.1 hypothetical protein [Maribacter sp.]HEA80838.1 hypothetical protein [Maribacter sp.]
MTQLSKYEDFQTCLNIAKGCHDYNGGYLRDQEQLEAFHHGIETVVKSIKSLTKNGLVGDQLQTLHSIGKKLNQHG